MTIDPGLMGRLLDEPQAYDFFQAVRLLEQFMPERSPVGEFADPNSEVVRFATPSTVGFPASQIQSLEAGEGDAPAQMVVNFLGLVGPQGALPLDYTLYTARRERAGDSALKDFIGLFEHRLISLFYRAWTKTQWSVSAARDVDGAVDHHLKEINASRDSECHRRAEVPPRRHPGTASQRRSRGGRFLPRGAR